MPNFYTWPLGCAWAIISGAVVASVLREGGKMTHCNSPAVLIKGSGLDQIHCAFSSERPGLKTRTVLWSNNGYLWYHCVVAPVCSILFSEYMNYLCWHVPIPINLMLAWLRVTTENCDLNLTYRVVSNRVISGSYFAQVALVANIFRLLKVRCEIKHNGEYQLLGYDVM